MTLITLLLTLALILDQLLANEVQHPHPQRVPEALPPPAVANPPQPPTMAPARKGHP